VIANATSRRHLPIGLVATGLVTLAVADCGFSYLTMKGTYAIGGAVDYAWFAGYLLIGVAALFAQRVRAAERDIEDRRTHTGLSVVHLPVLVAVGTAIGRVAADNPLGRFPKELAVGVVAVLVGRELVVQLESIRSGRRAEGLAQLLEYEDVEPAVTATVVAPVLTGTAP
jgi:hypothetical protein